MPTRRGWGLLAAAIGASLGARVFGSSELAVAAQAALVLLVLGIATAWVLSSELDIRRQVVPRRLFFDAEGRVEVTLRNDGRLPTPTLQIVDPVPAVVAEASRFVLSPLRFGRTAVLRYRLHGQQRGVFEIGPTRVLLRDPFGLAARRLTFDNAEKIVVYPPVWRLPGSLTLGNALSSASGRTRPAPYGDEFAGVREYVRGDDLRQVHWRTTARRGDLFVRQHEAPWTPRGTVLLDTRAQAHRGSGPGASLELAVAAAASTVHHLADHGLAVRLVLDGDDIGRPELPWELTLERLAQVQRRHDLDLTRILTRLASGHGLGTFVAVLGVPDTMELRALVRAGRSFGWRAALLVDGQAFATGAPGRNVDQIDSALRRANWRVGVLRPGDRVDHAWGRIVAQRPGSRAAVG